MVEAINGDHAGLAFLSPNSTRNPFRAKRIADIVAMCAGRLFTRIIDLGGTPGFWHLWRDAIDWQRTEITCVNLTRFAGDGDPVRCIQGDATDLHFIGDNAFDIAFSNSVIEHVGRVKMALFAREASRVAKRLYIQTPDYWFPIEAHVRLPGFQWLSASIRAFMLQRWQLGYFPKAATREDARRLVDETDLLTAREMTALFPGATIQHERFMGLSKSLVART